MITEHATILAATARNCHPHTHTPTKTDALLNAILETIDLATGITPAARPRAASPAHPMMSNRTRTNQLQAAPMNPVQRHYGTGESRAPNSDTDTGYWRHQYHRVTDHADRCEVIRRAGTYLASLLRRPADAPKGTWTDDDYRTDVLIEGHGWPLDIVARRFQLAETTIAAWRIDDQRHPLTGKSWSPPEERVFQAQAAREMRDAGLTSTTIAAALRCSASAVRMWTTKQRRAAA